MGMGVILGGGENVLELVVMYNFVNLLKKPH